MRCFYLLLIFSVLIGCRKKESIVDRPIDKPIETPPPVVNFVTQRINQAFGGYLVSTPSAYDQSDKFHPLLLFLHGIGQMGNGNSDIGLLTIDGIGRLLTEKKFNPVFRNGNDTFSFIVISPQYSRQPSQQQIMAFIQHAVSNYRIDTSRIYLSGLSSGGISVTEFAAVYPNKVAAIVPLAGVMSTGDLNGKCSSIAASNLPTWAIHNEKDPMISSSDSKKFVDLINSFNPRIKARLTLLKESGHDAWTRALDPSFREGGKNIYEWMLQYRR